MSAEAALRIALIAPSRHPVSQPFAGGLEAHIWHLARALAGDGHQVTLFAAEGSDTHMGLANVRLRPLNLTVRFGADRVPFGAEPADAHQAYLELMLQLAAGDMSFDVVHNHSLHYLPIKMAPIVTTPMLCTLHTPPFPWLEAALGSTGGRGARYAAVSRHTAAAWSHVVEDITVVGNGVHRESWPQGPGGTDLVWYGRITREKGPHLAIAAAQQAGLKLVLAGPISNRSYFTHSIAPQLGADISYAGHLAQDELSELVGASAAALVTPTWDEPYCLVAAEAMMCGTPVVAFARGGLPEIVDSRCGRLVPAGDVAAMATAIPEAMTLSRAVVHAHAASRCSANAMVAGYLNVYRAMLDDRRRTDSDDRLLHSPSRQRASQPGAQHLHAAELPGDGDNLTGAGRLRPVRRGPSAAP